MSGHRCQIDNLFQPFGNDWLVGTRINLITDSLIDGSRSGLIANKNFNFQVWWCCWHSFWSWPLFSSGKFPDNFAQTHTAVLHIHRDHCNSSIHVQIWWQWELSAFEELCTIATDSVILGDSQSQTGGNSDWNNFSIEVEFYFFYSDSTNMDGNNFAIDSFKARTSVVAFNRITLWSMTPLIVNWSEGEEASNCRLAFIARGDRVGCIGQGRPLVVWSRLGKPLQSFISTKSMRSYVREIILPTF